MKKTISWLMTIVMLCIFTAPLTACSKEAIEKYIENRETPIAKDYVPQTPAGEDNSFVVFEGDEIKSYASEDHYRAAQKKYAEDVSLYSETNERILQTITVLEWKGRARVVNAVVLINGVPRYTNRDGQVKAMLKKELFTEIRIEKEGYVPYVEILDIDGGNAEFEIKKPGDDIEVFNVRMEYEGEFFNLLNQPCYYNLDITESYTEIFVECNVKPESYIFYVNGEPEIYSDDGVFDFLDLTDCLPGDKFSLQVFYDGIPSKIYDLNLFIVKRDIDRHKLTQAETRSAAGSASVNMDHCDALGNVGALNFNILEMVNDLVFHKFNNNTIELNAYGNTFELGFFYNARKGTMEVTIGATIRINLKREYNYYEDQMAQRQQEVLTDSTKRDLKQKRKGLAKAKKELAELQEKAATDTHYKEMFDKRSAEFEELRNRYQEAKNNDATKAELDELKRLKHNACNSKSYYKRQGDKQQQQISNLVSSAKNMKDGIDIAKARLKEMKGVTYVPYGIKNIYNKETFSIDLDISFLGVFHYSLLTNQFEGTEITAGAKVRFSYTYQTIVWVIPMFVKVSGNIGLQVNFQLPGENELFDIDEFVKALTIIIQFGGRLDVGVGVSGVASVAGFGAIDFEFRARLKYININSDDIMYGKMDYKIGIRFELFCLRQEFSYKDFITLFGKENPDEVTQATFNLLNRSFLSSEAFSSNTLYSNLYQMSKPQLNEIGGKYVLTWLEDSRERDDYNRTVLKYSVSENGVWSKPADVYNDGYADFFPDTYCDGENLYITWQKSKSKFNANSSYTDMAAAGEIYFSQFDPISTTFSSPLPITNNTLMDTAPKFAVKEKPFDNLSIVWFRNSENNLIGNSGENHLLTSTFDGDSWFAETTIYTTEKIISEPTAAVKNGELTVALVEDSDSNMLTDDGKVTVVTAEQVYRLQDEKSSSLEFAVLDGAAELIYYDDGYLKRTSNFKDSFLLLDLPQYGVSREFSVRQNENGTAVFYQAVTGDNIQGCCSLFSAQTNEWTNNILLSKNPYDARYFDGVVGSDGNLHYVYNLANQDGLAQLCYAKKSLQTSFEITDAFYNDTLIPGEKNTVFISVVNCGDEIINEWEIEAFGQIVPLNVRLAIGESINLAADFIVCETNGKEELTVRAMKNGVSLASNRFLLTTAFTDITIEGSNEVVNGKQIFSAIVSNNSELSTIATIEIFVNGKLVESETIDLKAFEKYTMEKKFEAIEENDYVVFKVTASEEEYDLSDNKISFISMQKEDAPKVIDRTYYDLLQEAKRYL